jgi:hypothetical protein
VLLVDLIYSGVGSFGFVNLDDAKYVYQNRWIREGLTWHGVAWAFGTFQLSNWHPLTLLSHMADIQAAGLDPGWHHLVNVGLHAANALLVFAVFAIATGRTWRAAVVAALFAAHPLNVESVAWISERKNVLSTFFCLITMLTYVSYVRRPSPSRYLALVFSFVLGLLSKGTVVTLPVMLLALDFWPLKRVVAGAPSVQAAVALVKEKAPLFALSALVGVMTYLAQDRSGALISGTLPVSVRVANAILSCGRYLAKMAVPVQLSPAYPHPGLLASGVHFSSVAASACLLVVASALVWRARRDRPYLLAGWLWYVVTLLPVIGLVQAGTQGMADRYAYVPLIGIFAAVVWLFADWAEHAPARRHALAWFSAAGLFVCGMLARKQTQYWRDSITLFQRAVAIDALSYMGWRNLGAAYYDVGQVQQALPALRESLRLMPRDAYTWMNLALSYYGLERDADGAACFDEAARIRPGDPLVWFNMAVVAAARGDRERLERATARVASLSPELLAQLQQRLREAVK